MRTPIALLIRGDRAHRTVAGWLAGFVTGDRHRVLRADRCRAPADADCATDMLQPLKHRVCSRPRTSTIVVRAKFTSKPGAKLVGDSARGLRQHHQGLPRRGIKLAHKEVTVDAPQADLNDETVKAIAGAAARTAIVGPPKAV